MITSRCNILYNIHACNMYYDLRRIALHAGDLAMLYIHVHVTIITTISTVTSPGKLLKSSRVI